MPHQAQQLRPGTGRLTGLGWPQQAFRCLLCSSPLRRPRQAGCGAAGARLSSCHQGRLLRGWQEEASLARSCSPAVRQHLQLSQARRHLIGRNDQSVVQLLQGKQLQLMQLFRGYPTNLQRSKAGLRTPGIRITLPMDACPAGKRAMSNYSYRHSCHMFKKLRLYGMKISVIRITS